MRGLALALIALAGLLGPSAQAGAAGPDDAHPPIRVPRLGPAPAYEGPMLRLAELMGELHYLRGLCGAPEGSAWRDRMGDLLDGEAGDEGRRVALAAAFNRGYAALQAGRRRCDAGTEAVIRTALEEGGRLAHGLEDPGG